MKLVEGDLLHSYRDLIRLKCLHSRQLSPEFKKKHFKTILQLNKFYGVTIFNTFSMSKYKH